MRNDTKQINAKLKQATREFLEAFEEVFDKDWEYSKEMMGICHETEEQKHSAKEMGLETIKVIAEDATFLNPKADLDNDNWGNRAMLLEKYNNLKKVLKEIE